MSSSNSQTFIARNRAPRVQIEYEMETYGAQKKVNLPFIVGVMADLAGKSDSAEAKKPVGERKFLEIDIDNFDRRMAALKPKASFHVDNTLSGEGRLPVSIDFESMADFAPDKVAAKIGPLNEMMQTRNQLAALLTYMDGKSGAEELLAKVMANPDLLKTIAQLPNREPSSDAADA